MKYNKHIVLLSPSFPKNEENTIVTSALHLFAVALKNQLPETTKLSVVTLHFPFTNKPYSVFGINVYPIGATNKAFPTRLWFWYKAIKQLKNLHLINPISQLHTFWLNEVALIGEFFARPRLIPHCVTLMGQDALPENKYLRFLKNKKFKVVSISNFQAKTFEKTTGKKPSEIIPWGLPKSELSTNINLEKKYDLVGVGSITELKNFKNLIETIEILELKHQKITHNLLIGYGPQEAELLSVFNSKNLQSTFSITGKLMKRHAALALMEKGKILVHCAKYEGFGMVLIEALAKGCYVISTPVGIAPEINNPDFALAENPNEMSEKANYFLAKPTKNPELVFDVGETVNRYLKIYGL